MRQTLFLLLNQLSMIGMGAWLILFAHKKRGELPPGRFKLLRYLGIVMIVLEVVLLYLHFFFRP